MSGGMQFFIGLMLVVVWGTLWVVLADIREELKRIADSLEGRS